MSRSSFKSLGALGCDVVYDLSSLGVFDLVQASFSLLAIRGPPLLPHRLFKLANRVTAEHTFMCLDTIVTFG